VEDCKNLKREQKKTESENQQTLRSAKLYSFSFHGSGIPSVESKNAGSAGDL